MNALFPLLLLMLAGSVHAQDATGSAGPLTASSDFLAYHPDLGNRKIAVEAYGRGSFVVAMDYFRRASRYADKPSQAMVAEMLWKGQGVGMDRPLAYAWMDLAAERKYPSLLAFRERYWQELSAAGQARAIEVGGSVYAEYGDSIAKPRLAVQLRRGRLRATGSHTGFVGNIEIYIPSATGLISGAGIPGDQYYAPRFWREREYWAWKDSAWKAPLRGVVDVGPLQNVRDDDDNKSNHDKPDPDRH